MCQGFSHFPGFLHHFILANLANSSMRVKHFFLYLFQEQRVALSVRIQNAGTEVVEAKAGAVSIIHLLH